MPRPRSPKEIKQYLGHTVYYRKFVPRFSDISRPLTKLLAHDCEFKWNSQCDLTFQMLKDALCSAPILKYPDILYILNLALFNQMVVNMVGQVYSPRCTHLWWMEKKLQWIIWSHMLMAYFVVAS